MRRPVNSPYTITTEFGVRDSYAKFGYHSGVDYAVPTGRPIYAPVSGQLTNVVSPTGGNMVVIFDGRFYHRLMHNSSFSRGNGPVQEGQEVAKAGTTGLSTGPHCHWDINTQGTTPTSFSAFVSPSEWLAGKYVTQTPQGGEVLTLSTARILAERVLGRKGAIGGNADADLNKNHVGKDANAKILEFEGSSEGKAYQARLAALESKAAQTDSLKKQISDLQVALKNEQNKPPKEVIKEVVQIVKEPVEVVKTVEVEPSWLTKVREFLNNFLKGGK